MNVTQIASALQNAVQDEQLLLNSATLQSLQDSTIAALQLDRLLGLLESQGLVFTQPTITTEEDTVAIAGEVSLLGTRVVLEAIFQQVDAGMSLQLSAKSLPICHVPGASWLALQQGQLAMQVSATAVTGSISGAIQAGDRTIAMALLVGQQADEFVLEWTIAEISLAAIAQTFLAGATMPPELPDLAFKDVETVIKPRSGNFSFRAASAAPLNFPASGDGLSITQTQIAVERVVEGLNSQVNCSIALSGDRPIALADELVLNHYQLELELTGQEWRVAGEIAAEIFATEYTLSAAYSQSPEAKRFTLSLSAQPAIALVAIDQVGHLSLSSIAVELLKETAAEPGGAAASAWSVATTGAIVLTDVADVSGSLTLAKQLDGAVSLVFSPQQAIVRLPLPPDETAEMHLSFGEMAIVRRVGGTGRVNWRFEAAVALSFQGWHPTVHRYLPDTIATTFAADERGIQLTADRVVNPFDYALPDIDLGSDSVKLGNASIDVADLFIRIGQEITIAAQLGVGLPSELNHLFGTNANGTPKVEFFNTFDPSDRENTVVKAELRIGTAGIEVVPVSSIIRAISLVNDRGEALQPGEDAWWLCDMQDFGAITFKVPTFSYDATTSSFTASGAFDTIRPLSLPLTLVKELLSACKLQGAADALPAGLPLKGVEIVDDQGEFKVDELLAILGAVGANLPAEMREAIETIGDQLDKLPDSFKQYLNIEIPQSFAFDIAVTPAGTVRFDARVQEGDPPVKLLLPGMLGLMPVLNGVQLRRLSFGQFAGGSLFLLQVDATLDQFDLVTLATTAALPESSTHLLPPSRSLHRRLILDDLFMVIVYQTVIPIPIPLFYDEIGVEYLGLEGVELGAHAQFPMPTLDLVEAGKLLSNFKQFFTDREFLLDPTTPPKNLNLTFGLKKNFLQLPKYLAPDSALLGDRLSGPEINAYSSLANLLNGMKTFSINQLIQSMPIEQRVNSTSIAFGPFSGSLGWLITTPEEFRQLATQPLARATAYQRLSITTDEQAAGMMSVLPPAPAGERNEEGLVTFLRGHCAISNLASFETTFGLAASRSIGFNTGFRMVGKISDVMELGISGRVLVRGQGGSPQSASDPAFLLAGQSYLSFRNQSIFRGDVQISDRRFQCQGKLDLYGLGGSVMLAISDQGADLRGDLNPIDLGVFKLSGAGGRPRPSVAIQIRPNQVPMLDLSAAVELLGIRAETQVTMNDRGFQFRVAGSLFNKFNAAIVASGTRLNETANFRVAATMQNDLRLFLKTEATRAIQQAVNESQAKISAQQKQVDDAQANVNSLNQQIEQQRSIVTNERAAANRAIDSARQAVANRQATVNNLNSTISQKSAERDRLGREQSCTTTRFPIPAPTWRNPFAVRWENRTTCVPNPSSIARAGVLQGEITALQTQLGTEQTLLSGAQIVLDRLVRGAINTPVDLDPRVAALIGSRETATGVLNGYRQTLEITKRGLGAVGVAGEFVTRRGLDALLAVNSASFETSLSTATGGRVTMALSLTYQDRPTTLALDFNFNDPLASARALGQQLLRG